MKKIIITSIVALVILIVGGLYWLEIRPENVRKECFKKASEGEQQMIASDMRAEINGLSITKGDSEKFKDKLFNECLLKNGINK